MVGAETPNHWSEKRTRSWFPRRSTPPGAAFRGNPSSFYKSQTRPRHPISLPSEVAVSTRGVSLSDSVWPSKRNGRRAGGSDTDCRNRSITSHFFSQRHSQTSLSMLALLIEKVVPSVENVVRSRFVRYLGHCLGVVGRSGRNMHKCRYLSLCIIQCVHLNTALFLAKLRPPEHR